MFDIYQKVKGSDVEKDVYQFIFELYTNEDIYNGIKAKNEGLVNEAIDKHYNLIEELLIV